MRSTFKLFQSHLDLAHRYWQSLLQKGDVAVDATCGNGKDTLQLANCVLTEESGAVWAIDIQQEALDHAQTYIKAALSEAHHSRIHWSLGCHSVFPPSLQNESVQLIVYNLGYLPKGNKSLTTRSSTTLKSLEAALPLLRPGGAISITCYPGHPEGFVEQQAVLNFLSLLSPLQWSVCHHQWINRSEAPSLILVQKANN